MTKWQHDDFDPAYGLEGKEADSIMDWVRAIFPPFTLSHFLTRVSLSTQPVPHTRIYLTKHKLPLTKPENSLSVEEYMCPR